ncbi:MAG: substrate-binding domain-containing protein [Deltaproteobacteria bacterium]|nr:substrate-binding domain-containing protein [Deltaproteobacteria bacterium]
MSTPAQQKKVFFTLLVGLTLCFALINSAPAAEIIKIGGTGAGLGTMKLLGEAFERLHPEIRVQLVPGLGRGGGIAALQQGTLDVAVSGTALSNDEAASGLSAVEYARTPFVFVVHRNVIKTRLSANELEAIYNGVTNNWPGGKRIRLVLRPERDTDTKIIAAISPGMGLAMKSARARKGNIIAVTDQESAEAVSKTPGALGATTLTQIATEKLPLKILAFEGAVPNLTSVSTGSYRLFKSLYLVTTTHSSPAARLFADFIHSTQGTAILAQSGNLVIAPAEAK